MLRRALVQSVKVIAVPSTVSARSLLRAASRPAVTLGLVEAVERTMPAAMSTWAIPRRGYSSAAATSATATGSEGGASATQVAVNHATLQEIGSIVSRDPRHAMPFSEFQALCKKFGLNDVEARDIARGFHRTGTALFLEQGQLPEIKDVLLLQPKRVREIMDHVLTMQAVGAQTVDQYTHTLKQEIERYRAELAPLQQLKDECDLKARRHADRVIVAALGFLIGQWAVFFRLVWWELSWDVMEPISYMLGLTMNIIALMYFLSTRNEYTYEALRQRAIEKRARKLYAKKGLDIVRYEDLSHMISAAEEKLSRIEALPFPRLPVLTAQPKPTA